MKGEIVTALVKSSASHFQGATMNNAVLSYVTSRIQLVNAHTPEKTNRNSILNLNSDAHRKAPGTNDKRASKPIYQRDCLLRVNSRAVE
jgi:hypothetical protein